MNRRIILGTLGIVGAGLVALLLGTIFPAPASILLIICGFVAISSVYKS